MALALQFRRLRLPAYRGRLTVRAHWTSSARIIFHIRPRIPKFPSLRAGDHSAVRSARFKPKTRGNRDNPMLVEQVSVSVCWAR